MEPPAPPLPTFLDHRRAEERDAVAAAQPRAPPDRVHRVAGARVLQQRRPLRRQRASTGTGSSSRAGPASRSSARRHPATCSGGTIRPSSSERIAADGPRRPPDRDAAQSDRPGAVGDGAPHRGRPAAARLGARRPRARDAARDATSSASSPAAGTPRASSRTRNGSATACSSCCTTTSTTTRAASTTPALRHVGATPDFVPPEFERVRFSHQQQRVDRARPPAAHARRAPRALGVLRRRRREARADDRPRPLALGPEPELAVLARALGPRRAAPRASAIRRRLVLRSVSRARHDVGPGPGEQLAVDRRPQPAPREEIGDERRHETEVDRAVVPDRAREVEQRVVELGRTPSSASWWRRPASRCARTAASTCGVGRGEPEVRGEPRDRARAGRRRCRRGARAGGRDRRAIAANRYRSQRLAACDGTDGVAPHSERRRDLHRIAHDHDRRRDRRDRAPERQEQRAGADPSRRSPPADPAAGPKRVVEDLAPPAPGTGRGRVVCSQPGSSTGGWSQAPPRCASSSSSSCRIAWISK